MVPPKGIGNSLQASGIAWIDSFVPHSALLLLSGDNVEADTVAVVELEEDESDDARWWSILQQRRFPVILQYRHYRSRYKEG
jgi:hypothetical protein